MQIDTVSQIKHAASVIMGCLRAEGAQDFVETFNAPSLPKYARSICVHLRSSAAKTSLLRVFAPSRGTSFSASLAQ
jgi:hypothetical protein